MTTKAEAIEAKSRILATAERITEQQLGAGISPATDGSGWTVVVFYPRPLAANAERRISNAFPEFNIAFRYDPQAALHST